MWAEILKANGMFEAAKEKYRKAIELNHKDEYSEGELAKLNVFTEPQTITSLEDQVIDLWELKERDNPKQHREDCNCNII